MCGVVATQRVTAHATLPRKDWHSAQRDALVSGSAASMLSTAALAACGRVEADHAAAPTNASSHWVWAERAAAQNRPSLRYTALGFGIHHAASVFWAMLYEHWFGDTRDRGEITPALAGGAAVAALACFVDYRLTPERLKPGYEKRLTRPALLIVYAAFGTRLTLIRQRRR